jgi:hypothetical protein
MFQKVNIIKQKEATKMLVYGTRRSCHRFQRTITLPPLRTEMNFEDSKEDTNSGNVGKQQVPTSQGGRPPSIVLTETNLLILCSLYH